MIVISGHRLAQRYMPRWGTELTWSSRRSHQSLSTLSTLTPSFLLPTPTVTRPGYRLILIPKARKLPFKAQCNHRNDTNVPYDLSILSALAERQVRCPCFCSIPSRDWLSEAYHPVPSPSCPTPHSLFTSLYGRIILG